MYINTYSVSFLFSQWFQENTPKLQQLLLKVKMIHQHDFHYIFCDNTPLVYKDRIHRKHIGKFNTIRPFSFQYLYQTEVTLYQLCHGTSHQTCQIVICILSIDLYIGFCGVPRCGKDIFLCVFIFVFILLQNYIMMLQSCPQDEEREPSPTLSTLVSNKESVSREVTFITS